VGLEAVLVLRDPNVQLSLIVATAEQQVLQDEGLRKAGPLGEEATANGVGGPGGAVAIHGRALASTRKPQRCAPQALSYPT
jgi:hypothetical protein